MADGFSINSATTLTVGVETYAAYAVRAPRHEPGGVRMTKNTIPEPIDLDARRALRAADETPRVRRGRLHRPHGSGGVRCGGWPARDIP
jgi:hypothetical protein